MAIFFAHYIMLFLSAKHTLHPSSRSCPSENWAQSPPFSARRPDRDLAPTIPTPKTPSYDTKKGIDAECGVLLATSRDHP